VIFQLCLQEGGQVHDAVHLCILDILHAAEHIVIGFFILDLLAAQFFFHPEVLPLRLFHLRQRSVIRQSAAIKLLAGML
jgi:hypothetical protein